MKKIDGTMLLKVGGFVLATVGSLVTALATKKETNKTLEKLVADYHKDK